MRLALSFARQYFPQIRCQRISFGDQLKKASFLMFSWGGLQEAVYYDNHPAEREVVLPAIGLSPRQIWDEIGSQVAALCPKVWPEMALQEVDCDIGFVPDLRRPVEVDYVRQFHGTCVKINRKAAPVSDHIVDTALADFNDWNEILENDGTLRQFNAKIKTLVVTYLNINQPQGLLVCPKCFSRGQAVREGEHPGVFTCKHCAEIYGA